ncbi:MFS transporter [Glaciihabitans arcticus]|uniref:MFS transporter n=1 Tax=Glaciihabitans arcticus TaxID=2668039 RepID=A0A4Q9H0I9_9MICO|nr:MFS transporter [Glaciihabitans arcticus]
MLALSLWASGAPSVLYPVYADEWGLTSVITTSVFATYPAALLLVLLVFGSLSDTIGRRRAMLLGIGLIAVAAVIFAVAPNVGFLFAARALQGIGTGFAIGAASAALVENNYTRNPRLASTLATISTSTGLTLALIVSGALAELAPLPLVLSFAVLLVLSVTAWVLVALTPDDRPAAAVPFRFEAPHLAPGMTRAFILATISVSVAYAVGAIFLSLGANMARELAATDNLLTIGLLLGTSSLSIGVTALFLSRVPAHVAIIVGGSVSLLGLGVMVASAASGSLVLLLVWCVVGGIGYSFAFTGGLGLLNRTAPAEHRGATLSLLYLFAYLLQALAAVGAGALATNLGLRLAVDIAGPVLAALCVVAVVLSIADLAAQRRAAAALAV